MIAPKFRNRAERGEWLQQQVTNPEWVPAGYEPEQWDVVKDGRVTVAWGVPLARAEDVCASLNARNKPHTYEVVPSAAA